jgi:hypothetical protein
MDKFLSSKHAFEEFLKSSIWQDILQELSTWEARVMQELAEPTFDLSTGKMAMGKEERVLYDEMLRGNLQAFARFRLIPHVILQILEEQEQSEKEVLHE